MRIHYANANTHAYRYGFNGKESDNEVKGQGVQYDYGLRIYDARIGKFLSVDPLTQTFPFYTPYQFASNTPIAAIDLDGEEAMIVIKYTESQWFHNKMAECMTAYNISRLAWAAIAAKHKDGTPAATFTPDPNGRSGFSVWVELEDGELFHMYNNLSSGNNAIFESPVEPYADGEMGDYPLSVKKERKKEEKSTVEDEITLEEAFTFGNALVDFLTTRLNISPLNPVKLLDFAANSHNSDLEDSVKENLVKSGVGSVYTIDYSDPFDISRTAYSKTFTYVGNDEDGEHVFEENTVTYDKDENGGLKG